VLLFSWSIHSSREAPGEIVMKKRHVFATPSLSVAESGVQAARRSGIGNDSICLEARSDVEMHDISDDRKNVSMDFIPAAWRGTLAGAAAGALAGVIAMWIPFFGVSLAGASALAVIGAMVGTWASVLMGSAVEDNVRRTFHEQIQAGQILVVVDAEPEEFDKVEKAIASAGGSRLPFESNSALG
jgi:hypothetical protein